MPKLQRSPIEVLALSVLVLASAVVAGPALAQCGFDTPLRANLLKTYLTRHFDPCTSPNTTTAAGVAACSPPTAPSVYGFGLKGFCKLKTTPKLQKGEECGVDPTESPCSNEYLSLSCYILVDETGAELDENDEAWTFATVLRATIDDPSSGSMTMIDVPVDYAVPIDKPRRLKVRTSLFDALLEIFGPGGFLPGCASVELVDAALEDPDGRRFAGFGWNHTYAACGMNSPGKALGRKTRLVRAFESCPGVTNPSPNAASIRGVPACAAPVAVSSYSFGAGGKCTYKAKAAADDSCSQDPGADDCLTVVAKLVCADIRDAGGDKIMPAADEWKLRVSLRATIDDRGGSTLTEVDRTIEIGNRPGQPGTLTIAAELAELLAETVGDGASLPICSTTEVLDVSLIDPEGNVFAVPGSFAPR